MPQAAVRAIRVAAAITRFIVFGSLPAFGQVIGFYYTRRHQTAADGRRAAADFYGAVVRSGLAGRPWAGGIRRRYRKKGRPPIAAIFFPPLLTVDGRDVVGSSVVFGGCFACVARLIEQVPTVENGEPGGAPLPQGSGHSPIFSVSWTRPLHLPPGPPCQYSQFFGFKQEGFFPSSAKRLVDGLMGAWDFFRDLFSSSAGRVEKPGF